MSNVKGQPGYIDMSKPREKVRQGMRTSGTVEPPAKPKKPSGKERKATKDRAARLVEKTLNSPEWFVIAYRVNQETGAVEMAYEMSNFPHNSFEEAAQLFADCLTKTLGESFDPNPAPAPTAEPAAQTSELTDEQAARVLDALPNNLGAPPSEQAEPGSGEPD
jgi:hypothetical protein